MSQPAPIKPLKVLLPADLQKRLQDSVKRRLGRFKLGPQFDLYPPRKSAPNDGTIKVALPHRLSGGLRKINTLSKILELYLVRGPSLWHRVRFTDEKSDDPRRERYQQLQQDIGQREKSKEFLRVVHQKLVLEEKEFYLKEEQEIVKELQGMLERMQLEDAYWAGLDRIFNDTVAEVTGITTLEGLMKGLVKIMIVDDLGTRTLDGIVALNYSRKYLSFMSSSELETKFKAFKQQHLEDQEKETNISEFIFKSPDFESIDIVFFNRWNFSDDEFLVPVLLRKKTILSKQEQRKSNQNPEYIEKQIESETNSIKQAEKNLKEVLKEINKMEKGRYQEEDEYQALRSSQKRIQKDIDRRKNRLKSLEKPVKQSDQAVVIKFDLYETFKEKQSFMDRLGDKVADWGLDSLWEKHMNPDDRFSFNKLHQMSGVAKEWIKRNNEYNRSKLFTERLKDQLNDFAGKYGMLVKESRSRAAGPGSYQPMLDDHILNSLELAVINCEILNRIEQSRENAKDQL